MGSIVPAPPLPHRYFYLEGYGQMVEDVPGTGGESRLPRQGFMRRDRME